MSEEKPQVLEQYERGDKPECYSELRENEWRELRDARTYLSARIAELECELTSTLAKVQKVSRLNDVDAVQAFISRRAAIEVVLPARRELARELDQRFAQVDEEVERLRGQLDQVRQRAEDSRTKLLRLFGGLSLLREKLARYEAGDFTGAVRDRSYQIASSPIARAIVSLPYATDEELVAGVRRDLAQTESDLTDEAAKLVNALGEAREITDRLRWLGVEDVSEITVHLRENLLSEIETIRPRVQQWRAAERAKQDELYKEAMARAAREAEEKRKRREAAEREDYLRLDPRVRQMREEKQARLEKLGVGR